MPYIPSQENVGIEALVLDLKNSQKALVLARMNALRVDPSPLLTINFVETSNEASLLTDD